MVAATTKERILTDNEKYGSGILDENAPGGVWIVIGPGGYPSRVCANRQIAQECIWAKPNPGDYTLQVWSVTTEWPPRDEE